MAEEETQVVELLDEFYRDSFGKVMLIMMGFCIAIISLLAISLYINLNKPPPITFPVGDDMRVLPPVPLDQPYLSRADVLQWVADVLPKAFVYDFNHYNDQLKVAQQYFTQNGWETFLNQLNIYANYNNVQTNKLFVNAAPTAAPIFVNEGLIEGKYGWWVQMPLMITYTGFKPPVPQAVTLQLLVIRVPTLNNLTGVGIDDVMQAPATGPAGNQAAGNG